MHITKVKCYRIIRTMDVEATKEVNIEGDCGGLGFCYSNEDLGDAFGLEADDIFSFHLMGKEPVLPCTIIGILILDINFSYGGTCDLDLTDHASLHATGQ